MENEMLLYVVSILWILFISSYTLILGKRLGVPYVILLFLIWIFLFIIQPIIPFFEYVDNIQLSWDLLFYVLLPILLFESAFNMSSKKLINDAVPIVTFAVWGFIISNVVIGFWLHIILSLVWLDIPLYMTFLFWAIISATDPIAVLSLFKEYWAPSRLTYFFEWESIMNDWVAVAFFLIIIDIIRKWVFDGWDFMLWIWVFTWMMIFWIMWWIFIWVFFSKLIQNVRNINTELTLSFILAHTAFISSELISKYFIYLSDTTWIQLLKLFQISPIIATAFAGLTLWNYWKYKLSSNVRNLTKYFFDYFTFISNSIIFILMWVLIWHYLDLLIEYWFPITITILVVMVARMISIYWVVLPFNHLSREFEKIPSSWSKIMAWWSLRWGIAITMVLITPKDISIPWWDVGVIWITPYEFLAVITISCIVFTLTVKALSLWKLIKKMWIIDLSKEEEFTKEQIRHILDWKIVRVLSKLKTKRSFSARVLNLLAKKYKYYWACEEERIEKIKLWERSIVSLLQKYSLWIEKYAIIQAFENSEIDEFSLKTILYKIDKQRHRLDIWFKQLTEKEIEKETWFQKFKTNFYKYIYFWNDPVNNRKFRFLYYRARAITAEKVIYELEILKEKFCKIDNSGFDILINRYKKWYEDANNKKLVIYNEFENELKWVEQQIASSQAIHHEIWFLNSYYKKWILTGKVYNSIYQTFTNEDAPE